MKTNTLNNSANNIETPYYDTFIELKYGTEFPVIATGSIPNGYFGERLDVEFIFCEQTGHTYIQHSTGHCESLVNKCVDIQEAQWQLQNHPLCRQYYKNIMIIEQK
jgi:hypothetical protein